MAINPIWIGSPNFHPQNGVPKTMITLHWMVGNLLGTDRAFNGTRKASSTYGVEGSVVHQYVQEKDYPFSDGNTYANQHTISIEHAGGWLLPNGTRFKPTAETHETSAQLCADIARRHALGKLVVGVNIFPHNHWVATACPGSLDIHWIADRANQINGDPDRPTGNPATPPSVVPKADAITLKVQTALKALGFNPGALDGIPGPLTRAAIVAFQQKVGGLVVDGIAGPLTQAKLFATPVPAAPAADASVLRIQTALKAKGFDPGPLDGIMGAKTKAAVIAFQKAVGGLVVDGIPGPATQAKLFAAPAPASSDNLSLGSTGPAVLAVQTKLRKFYPAYAAGLAKDGIFGPATEAAVREFQRRSGLVVDGIVGPATRSRLGV